MTDKINKLPEHFVNKINKTVQVDTTQAGTPLEAILAEKAKMKQPIVPPTAPQVPVVEIDEYVLPADEMALFMYVVSTVLAKDPRVRRILNKFKFGMKDLQGKQIFPEETKPLKKKKSKKK